jgi:predicted membrane-bound mannosyltransferase
MKTEEKTQVLEAPEPRKRPFDRLRRARQAEERAKPRLPLLWWELVGYGGLLVTALIMRLWDLGSRALHHDESLHAFYSWQLYDGKGYQHNPMMHGPFQFEANAGIFFILGDSDFTSRLLYALMGTVLVGLPFFFRDRLGRLGGLILAGLLALSPTMLYFSRFARNDIIMAVWTLGLVICLWRYIDEGKNRYFYISSALLALAFATQETAYITVAVLGMALALLMASGNWARPLHGIQVEGMSPPGALWRFVSAVWTVSRNGVKLSEVSRPAALLIFIITLTLPQWSAALSLFQDTPLLSWTNLTLANPEGVSPIGAPSGGGMVVAFIVAILLFGLSVYVGSRWNWPVWWRSAAIFYTIWVLLYTTFFTNIVGVGSGMWQSLGYWVAQQDVARGGQPWYYYFVITPIYEFLPLLFAVIGAVYYLRRGDSFGHFLVFWAAATLILYTVVSEKMPWILVNVALPVIVLAGKFLGDMVQGIHWRQLVANGGLLLLPGVPLLLLLLWRLAFLEPDDATIFYPLLLTAGVAAVASLGVFVARRVGVRDFAAFAAVPLAVVLLVLMVRAGARAAYQNGDTPVEMLVYTQTSPDITRLMGEIEEAGDATGQGASIPITVDQTSGFTWPWAWYLRDYTRVGFPSYSNSPPSEPPDSDFLFIHANNQGPADQVLRQAYNEGQRIKHRWWFPEETYRNLTVSKFLKGFADRDTWRKAMDFWLHRKGIKERIGSEDAYVYISKDMPPRASLSP